MCEVCLTLSLVTDTDHSKAPRMEARNIYRNLVGKSHNKLLHEIQD